jgi:hypothetical protein
LKHLDIPNAFLNADVDANICMYEPEEFSNGNVLKLKRSLYSLKQAPWLWFINLKSHLLGIGFTQCTYDPCVFTKSLGDRKFAFIAFHVDDIILGTNDDQEMLNVLCSLEKRF